MSLDPLSLFILSCCCCWLWVVWRSNAVVGHLVDLPTRSSSLTQDTSLSVIITACDEAETIDPATRTLLEQTLPGLEFIAVNDRSLDGTGAILDELATTDERLKVVHIEALPGGWLGKTHAMQQGLAQARGEWILFTDADVHFGESVLERALAEVKVEGLDHLTLIPHMRTPTVLLDLMVTAFAQVFFIAMGVGTSKPRTLGAGAFNLVRRSALPDPEGLDWLRMEVADDTGLARLVEAGGGSSGFRMGTECLHIEWYPTALAMFRGLEKNSYLLMSQGSPLRMLGLIAALIAVQLGPVLGLWLRPSPAAFVSSLVLPLLFMLVTLELRRRLGRSAWPALLAPVGVAMMVAVGLWSMIQTLRKDGIRWRGTYYPLEQLIAGQRVKL